MIKKLTILIIILVLNPLNLYAKQLRHFNPDIFGKSVDESVKLLLADKHGEAIMPVRIQTDVGKEGIINGASIHYPYEMTLEQARASINKLYKKYEVENFKDNKSMGLWRNEDKGFAIQLVVYMEGIEQFIQVIYLPLCKNKTKCSEEGK